MHLKLFRINRQIKSICKVSLCVFCVSVIFYFDVPVHLFYNKIRPLKKNPLIDVKEISKPTPQFHVIHEQYNDNEYRTFKSLEEEREQMKEYHRLFVEHLKSERLDRLAKKWFREEYNEHYSGEDNYDDDDEYDDEEDDKDTLVVSYKSNHESVQEINTKEIEYQLRGEKLPSVILPPGLLQLGRLYSLFFYLQGIIPGTEKDPTGWPKNRSRWTIDYINRYNDTSFTHFSKDICGLKKPLILIIICSRPRNTIQRQSIRNTWAHSADQYNTTILFLMGIPPDRRTEIKILQESNLHKDVILEHFDDTYNNLTLKTIFMLKWVQMYCAQVPFVLKIDDDVYLNVENLYNYIKKVEQTNDTSKLLVGKVEPNAKPFRDSTNKWYMPYYLHRPESYPNFTHGVAYLMSKQVASTLYEYTLTKEFIHLEDVFLTGMCAQELNIKPIDQEEFHFLPDPTIGCGNELFPKLAVVCHHVKALDMYKIHYSALSCSIISF